METFADALKVAVIIGMPSVARHLSVPPKAYMDKFSDAVPVTVIIGTLSVARQLSILPKAFRQTLPLLLSPKSFL